MIVELNSDNFEKNTSTGLKLIEFYTDWCGYCKKQRPVVEEISKNNIWIGTIDADKNPQLADRYNINGFPTFILLKDGEVISTIHGYHNKSELLSDIMKSIG